MKVGTLFAIFMIFLFTAVALAGDHTQDKFIISPGENFTWNITGGADFKYKTIMLPNGIELTSPPLCNGCNCNFILNTSLTLESGVYSVSAACIKTHPQTDALQNIKVFTASIVVGSFGNLTEYYNKTEIDAMLLNILNNISELKLTLESYYNKTEIDNTISGIINELNSLKSYIEANEGRWSFVGGGVSLATVRSEIDKAIKDLKELIVTKTTFAETSEYLSKLKSDIEEIRKGLEAVNFSLKCGNGVCEGEENIENCPQDCAPPLVAVPKQEGIGMVGHFLLANAPSIVAIALVLLISAWFYIKKLR